MMKIVLLFLLLLNFSFFSTTLCSPCMKTPRRNAGKLSFPEGSSCSTFTWVFDVRDRSILSIDLSTVTNGEPVLVKRKSSLNEPFVVSDRINSELYRQLRISSPTRQVALTVPSSRVSFEARFRMLRRAPSLSPSTERCRVQDPSVATHCQDGTCVFTCSYPSYIPRHKSVERVECRSENWHHQVNDLCMPRENLRDLCFRAEGETIKCEFNPDDFVKFFKNEELEAEDGVPPPRTPRFLGVSSNRGSSSKRRRAKFKDYVCKRRDDDGKYRFKCSRLKRRVMTKCMYWRYMTTYCKTGDIFS